MNSLDMDGIGNKEGGQALASGDRHIGVPALSPNIVQEELVTTASPPQEASTPLIHPVLPVLTVPEPPCERASSLSEALISKAWLNIRVCPPVLTSARGKEEGAVRLQSSQEKLVDIIP